MSNKTEIFLCRDNTDRVRVAHATTPALNTDYAVAFVKNTQPDGLTDTPLETLVNVFLPVGAAEVGLRFREAEGIDAAVEVSVSRGRPISGDHNDGAHGAVLG